MPYDRDMTIHRPGQSDEPTGWITTALAVASIAAVWMFVLLKLGVAGVTRLPGVGVLPNTFNGWAEHPEAGRYFLVQFSAQEFGRGASYTSYTLPFVITMYALIEPFHRWLALPYAVAQNVSAYANVACLTLLLVLAARDELRAVFSGHSPFRWLLAFLSIGIVFTDPLPWVSLLLFNRDCFHVLAAASFCYLSIWVFRDRVPRAPLLAVGIFLALWSPIYVPAWMLAVVFFDRTLSLPRRSVVEMIGVCALAALNLTLPALVSRWAGFEPVSSGFFFRSGLDGSTQYVSTIHQAVVAPVDPRHWPLLFYPIVTAGIGLWLHGVLGPSGRRPLQQALFLAIPYATVAIALPQFTSIHPYMTDLLVFVPCTFLIAFWFLQREFWQNLTGRTYAAWLLAAGLVLMTNLLTVAQNMRARPHISGALRRVVPEHNVPGWRVPERSVPPRRQPADAIGSGPTERADATSASAAPLGRHERLGTSLSRIRRPGASTHS